MNPFATCETVVLVDGLTVRLPSIQNDCNNLNSITFEKPEWIPDKDAHLCLSCNLKFTQFRRKHHCRNCGQIFCHNCCSEKVCLPHYGMKDPERICNNCKLIVELMTKLQSDKMDLKLEAIIGLSNLTRSSLGICKVIESGGVHIMLSLVPNGTLKLKSAVAHALHNIAQNMVLNSFLVEIGSLKVLKDMLSFASYDNYELLNDSLNALYLLCTDNEIKIKALKEGIIEPLLTIINYTGVIAVLATRVLQLLISNFDYHQFVSQNHNRIIPELLKAIQNEDNQVQVAISKMLVQLSAGTDIFRQIIVQQDILQGFPLVFLLKAAFENILIYAVCIIANLAITMDQNFAHHYIAGMCELLEVIDNESEAILSHLGRGLANFAEDDSNCLQLIQHLHSIVSKLLESPNETHRIHACRIIIRLLYNEPSYTIEILSQNGINRFLPTLFELPGICDILNNLLLRKVSKLSIWQ